MNSLASLLGHEKRINTSWISRWKSRHAVVSKKMVGEAASVDRFVVIDWKHKIPPLMREFGVEIFNVDETALFWKLLPDRTMSFKREEVRGGKLQKDRVTVLVGGSLAGEKLPLLIIGHSKKPIPRLH